MQVTAVSFDAKSGNYIAKVGSKTIKSFDKKYVERKVKAMVGDVATAVNGSIGIKPGHQAIFYKDTVGILSFSAYQYFTIGLNKHIKYVIITV